MAEAKIRVGIFGRDASLGKTLNKSGRDIDAFSKSMRKVSTGMVHVGKGLTNYVTLPLVAAGAASVMVAAKYETSMNQVQAASGASGKQMQKLSDLAMKMGADTMYSANDAAAAMLELAKGGMKPATIQAGGLKASMDLAAAGGLQLAAAAETTIRAMGMFGLKAKDAGRIADIFAGGANASTASVEDLTLALQQVGPGARNAGLSLSQTVGVLAAFADKGIRGSDAGTSLKTMLARLVPQTDKQAKAMKALGLSFVDSKGNIDDITVVAQKLHDKLGPLSQEQRSAALATIFGSDATRAATILMNEGAKGLEKYIKATQNRSAAEKMAEARTKGTAGSIERMLGSIETLGIKLGTMLAPYVVEIVKKIESIANWLNKLSPGWQKFIVKAGLAAAALGPVLIGVGKVGQGVSSLTGLWGKVTRATKDAGTVAGTLSGTLGTMGAVAVPAVLAGLGLALVTLRNMNAEAAKYNDQGQRTGTGLWGAQSNPRLQVDTTGVGKAIADLMARIQRLQAKVAEKLAIGDLAGAEKILAKIATLQGKVNVLRDNVKQPMAVGHLNAGPWNDAILHATDKMSYFRSLVKQKMAVGHLNNSPWTKPIKTALQKYLEFLSMVKQPMAVGHLDASGWLSPLNSVAAKIAAIRAAAAVPLAVGHGGGGFTGGGGGGGGGKTGLDEMSTGAGSDGLIHRIPEWIKRTTNLVEARWEAINAMWDKLAGLQDAADQVAQDIVSLTGTIMGTVNLWPQYIETVDELGNKVKELQLPTIDIVNPDDLSKVMDANVSNMQDWTANMDKLRAAGLPQELLDELTAMGLGGAGQVAGLASMTADQLAKWTGGWLELQKMAGAEAQKTYKDAQLAAVNALNQFTEALLAALKKLNGGVPISKGDAGSPTITQGGTGGTIPGLATGGIVTRKTLAYVGEGGSEEAIIPLPKGWRTNMTGGGDTYIQVDARGATDPAAVRRAVHEGTKQAVKMLGELRASSRRTGR